MWIILVIGVLLIIISIFGGFLLSKKFKKLREKKM